MGKLFRAAPFWFGNVGRGLSQVRMWALEKTTPYLLKLPAKSDSKTGAGRDGLSAFIRWPARCQIRSNVQHRNPLLYWIEIPIDRGFVFGGAIDQAYGLIAE